MGKIGAILITLSLCASPAYASQSGSAPSAPCSNPNNVVGAHISPLNVSCTIVAQYSGTWQFVAEGSGPNHTLKNKGSSYGIPASSKAELCANTGPGYGPYTGIEITGTPRTFTGVVSSSSPVIRRLNFNAVGLAPGTPISGPGIAPGAYVVASTPISITMNANGTVNGPENLTLSAVTTYEAMTIVYEENLQSSNICMPARGYFIDATTGAAHDTAQQSLHPGHTVEWKAPPHGLIWGMNHNLMATADVTASGVTIKLDPGFIESGVSALQPPGHDPINIGANDVTIRGMSSESVLLENNSGGGNDAVGQIDVFPGAKGTTLSGMTLTWADQNLNFGGDNGAITISDVQVWFGGVQGRAGNFGQQHNIYLSNKGSTGNDGPVRIINLQSYNVQTGGYLLKDRVNNTTITESYFGCTVTPTAAKPGCEMNTPIDFPCAGNQTISYSVIERNMFEADTQGSAPAMVRYGEEVGPASGSTACSEAYGTGYATNSLTLDHDIILNDAPPWHGYDQPWYVVQMGCNWHTTGMSCRCTISNSIIIGNNGATGRNGYGGLSDTGGAGASGRCADGGGNRVFPDRSAAAAALGWSGNDRFGNPCCVFPWQPLHPRTSGRS